MTDSEIIQQFKLLIENHCGMMITEVHLGQLQKYLQDTTERSGISQEDLFQQVCENPQKLVELINAVVVNETYFFREEKQFLFLEKYITENFAGKNIVIWSAACSTGEEPYSLASLALNCKANPIVYATDIDTDALTKLKNGVYGENSFRPDGKIFYNCLTPYLSEAQNKLGQKIFCITPELKEKVLPGRANLLDLSSSSAVPQSETVDILFIRNVFIYFNQQNRIEILKKLVSRLAPGGLLFFSISEIGSINPVAAGVNLEKRNNENIYYFVKSKKTLKSEKTGCCAEIKDNSKREQFLAELKKEASKTGERISLHTSLNSQTASSTVNSARIIPKTEKISDPVILWERLIKFLENKDFTAASALLDSFTPQLNILYYKYYFQGSLQQALKNEEQALELFAKAGMSNPEFWPAHFQIAVMLENRTGSADKKKRHAALLKTTSILEDSASNGDKFSWLMGAFSSSYFYKICNESLRKEVVQND